MIADDGLHLADPSGCVRHIRLEVRMDQQIRTSIHFIISLLRTKSLVSVLSVVENVLTNQNQFPIRQSTLNHHPIKHFRSHLVSLPEQQSISEQLIIPMTLINVG